MGRRRRERLWGGLQRASRYVRSRIRPRQPHFCTASHAYEKKMMVSLCLSTRRCETTGLKIHYAGAGGVVGGIVGQD